MTPDEFTSSEIMLDVGDGHSLYIQDWGNPKAKLPIVFLHGGPGNGCSDSDKRKFDPAKERVIFHDQRGSGKSTPCGSLENNQTDNLIADIDKIKQKFGLDEFIMVGGSWGSTLSLLYAIAHPDKVKGLVIDGIYMGTRSENDWIDDDRWRLFYPDIWEKYVLSVPEEAKEHPTRYHLKQAMGNDPEKAKKSIYEYTKLEMALLKIDDIYTPGSYDKFDPSSVKIEIHYVSNNCFIEDGYILKNSDLLTMPIRIIQGRYDMVCPPRAAYELSQKLSDAKLVWTINGHLRGHEAKNLQRLFISELLGNK
jgi:proline iminopeptidase